MILELISKDDLQAMEARILSKMREIFDVRSNNGADGREWLTVKEACEYLKVSKSTMQKYRREGIIPFSQHGRKILFKLEDLQNFLTKNNSKQWKTNFLA